MGEINNVVKKTALAGIAGIVASGKAPAYAKDMKLKKIGVLGLGSHNFATRFKNPPDDYKKEVLAKPYAIWDDCQEAAKVAKGNIYEKVYKDPVKLAIDCDCIHIEHADYRKGLELAQLGLEQGKPTFLNRPFVAKIEDAEEIVRLAKRYNAPLMSASSLEFGPDVTDMQEFLKENGPVRAYEAYGAEAHFTWHFPHVLNYAHAALGGGIKSVYFTGHFGIDMRKWRVEKEPVGTSLCVLTYTSREGQPPIIGMCHIGTYPTENGFHVDVYAAKENRNFVLKGKWDMNMFDKLNEFYSFGKVPRPYEAILEMHRTLVAANVSRLRGCAVNLDSLGGQDALPYSDGIRRYVLDRVLKRNT
ncbi:MAG: Gfo/Idh/MocA family oxidoreductase [Candidatus Latescibacteria bacterium]|nr:Gfo/Idh/MocA family oxidoreductase [Candidatus Latescibacterota bacterium]